MEYVDTISKKVNEIKRYVENEKNSLRYCQNSNIFVILTYKNVRRNYFFIIKKK